MITGTAAYQKYLDELKLGCDCDFHKGRWSAVDPPVLASLGLKYGRPRELLSDECCNHPSKTIKTNSGALDTLAAFNAKARTSIAPPGGCRCKRCQIVNEYAAPNQKDGTYVCFSCRV